MDAYIENVTSKRVITQEKFILIFIKGEKVNKNKKKSQINS